MKLLLVLAAVLVAFTINKKYSDPHYNWCNFDGIEKIEYRPNLQLADLKQYKILNVILERENFLDKNVKGRVSRRAVWEREIKNLEYLWDRFLEKRTTGDLIFRIEGRDPLRFGARYEKIVLVREKRYVAILDQDSRFMGPRYLLDGTDHYRLWFLRKDFATFYRREINGLLNKSIKEHSSRF